MNRSVFWALVRKDVYLMRGFIAAAIATGLLAFVIIGQGKIGMAVGGILFLTASVASGIFIAMYLLLTDRVSNSRLFALSLPISAQRHDVAKLVSGYCSFGIPWIVLTVLVLLTFLVPEQSERGMVIYGLLIQGFVLALFSVVLSALFLIRSEPKSGLVILGVNICFSLFMVQVNQPEVTNPFHSDQIVLTPFAIGTFVGEAAVVILTIAFSLLLISRKRDHL